MKRVLTAPTRQGWLRREFSDPPVFRKGKLRHRPFDLVTPDGLVVEALVEGWTNHNLIVAVPQQQLLATYGLRPRLVESDQSVRWDDPEHATYDVLIVHPVSRYGGPDEYTEAGVVLRSDYARDYAAIRDRAIVQVIYEQQSVAADAELDALLADEEYLRIDLSGLGIEVKRTAFDAEFPLFVAAWCCRLLVAPGTSQPITNNEKPTLSWPGFGEVDGASDFTPGTALDRIYVRDAVLQAFETREEFEVNPEHGSVSYEGRWELSFSHRFSRDYIAYELRKLYEGCPRAVITRVHAFVVDEAEAAAQRATLGSANIGSRAARFVAGLLALQRELVTTAAVVGLKIDFADIATPTPEAIEYSGWWTFDHLKALGRTAPQEMDRATILSHAPSLYSPFERLKEKPLRQMVTALGLSAADVASYRSLKLLSSLAQLASIAEEAGLSFADAAGEISCRWNKEVKLDLLRPLFALNDLRQLGSHTTPSEFEKRLKDDLAAFGVDVVTITAGWGLTLDQLYDRTAESIEGLTALLQDTR